MGLSWQDIAGIPFGGAGFLGAAGMDKANNNGILGGVANSLEGNPNGLSASLQKLMETAFGQGKQINTMLQGEKANSEAYYRPMQAMFGKMYGTGGLMPAKAPGAPGGGSY